MAMAPELLVGLQLTVIRVPLDEISLFQMRGDVQDAWQYADTWYYFQVIELFGSSEGLR